MTSRTGPVGVGFIGTGMISNTYLENLTKFPDVNVVILGDLNPEVAKARAEQHGVPYGAVLPTCSPIAMSSWSST